MRDKIIKTLKKYESDQESHNGDPYMAVVDSFYGDVADEILALLQESEKFRASEPYFYITNAKRFLNQKDCYRVALALLDTKSVQCLNKASMHRQEHQKPGWLVGLENWRAKRYGRMVSDVSESWNKHNQMERKLGQAPEAVEGAGSEQPGGIMLRYGTLTNPEVLTFEDGVWVPLRKFVGDIGQPLEAGDLERARWLIRRALELLE